MRYCSMCGKEVMDEAAICPHCGCQLKKTSVIAEDDAPSTGWAVLGFFIPLVGLILYLVNKDTMPMKAKSAGKGALIGVVAGVVASVVIGMIYVALVGAAIDSMVDSVSSYYYY